MTPIPRRDALRLIGAAGAGLVFVACGGDDREGNSTATTNAESTTTAGAAGTTVATGADAGAGSRRAPSETSGPFPADGTNGPNVLDDRRVVRSDITRSFGDFSGTASGVPILARLKVVRAGSGAPFAGAAVYLWQCDADALYSLYSQGATDQNYCRGVQAADAAGALAFKTIFPAAYNGRYPHFHYEVFPSLSAMRAGNGLLTSQIALPEDACDAVYEDEEAYPNSARNMQETSLRDDGVFRDSYQAQIATMSGNPSAGYTLDYTVVV